MRFEKDLMKQISKRLAVYKLTRGVLWYSRLQSGKAKVGAYYINLNEPGTPDWIALIDTPNGLLGLFIEAKSDTGKLTKDQEKFYLKYNTGYIQTIVVKNINELDSWILSHAKDFVSCLPTDL